MSKRRTSRSPIGTLPPELLLIIFKFVYVTARHSPLFFLPCFEGACIAEEKCFCDGTPSEGSDWTDDEYQPLGLFPNSVASVCSLWGNIMLLVPIFWTRIIIILDSEVFPPPNLDLQLRASGERPIDIIVTRASQLDAVCSKDIEQSRMMHIVNVLRPHFQRCRKLRFRVVHSSSLPCLSAVLPPTMPHMQKLLLKSAIDSGRPEVKPYDLLTQASLFQWSRLRTITIDGWNFTDLHTYPITPSKQIFKACRTLSITFGGEGFPFSSVVKLLKKVHIDTFEVDSVTFTQGDDIDDLFSVDNLCLKNLNAEVTGFILSACDLADALTITNCAISSIRQMPVTDNLFLKDIGLGQGFGEFLRTWCGEQLVVTSCPGLNDEVVEMMCLEDESKRYALGMKGLNTRHCNGFTLEAMKKLVEVRSGTLQDNRGHR